MHSTDYILIAALFISFLVFGITVIPRKFDANDLGKFAPKRRTSWLCTGPSCADSTKKGSK